jgi:NAD(P)-dependent dehydrogenase (short-subunit alcohol dehydrogenase family)
MKLNIQPGVAAISGGVGDIGRAIAKLFAEAGCRVALGDIEESGDPVLCGDAFYYQKVDVADPEAVEGWYDCVEAHFDEAPRYIIPNAAIVTLKRYLEITAEEWKRELDINLNGAFYFATEGARRLIATKSPAGGRIVFIGSWAAHAPHPSLPTYSVAKAGLRMLNQTLALELAPHGILVNEVAPGFVDAGLSGRVFSTQPETRLRATESVPIGKLLSADDVAAQVLYLCSDAGSQTTGSTLLIDGGLSLLQGPR